MRDKNQDNDKKETITGTILGIMGAVGLAPVALAVAVSTAVVATAVVAGGLGAGGGVLAYDAFFDDDGNAIDNLSESTIEQAALEQEADRPIVAGELENTINNSVQIAEGEADSRLIQAYNNNLSNTEAVTAGRNEIKSYYDDVIQNIISASDDEHIATRQALEQLRESGDDGDIYGLSNRLGISGDFTEIRVYTTDNTLVEIPKSNLTPLSLEYDYIVSIGADIPTNADKIVVYREGGSTSPTVDDELELDVVDDLPYEGTKTSVGVDGGTGGDFSVTYAADSKFENITYDPDDFDVNVPTKTVGNETYTATLVDGQKMIIPYSTDGARIEHVGLNITVQGVDDDEAYLADTMDYIHLIQEVQSAETEALGKAGTTSGGYLSDSYTALQNNPDKAGDLQPFGLDNVTSVQDRPREAAIRAFYPYFDGIEPANQDIELYNEDTATTVRGDVYYSEIETQIDEYTSNTSNYTVNDTLTITGRQAYIATNQTVKALEGNYTVTKLYDDGKTVDSLPIRRYAGNDYTATNVSGNYDSYQRKANQTGTIVDRHNGGGGGGVIGDIGDWWTGLGLSRDQLLLVGGVVAAYLYVVSN